MCIRDSVCTATDIAVRLGMAELGDRSRTAHLSEAFAQKALAAITALAADAIDAMKAVSYTHLDV